MRDKDEHQILLCEKPETENCFAIKKKKLEQ